MTCVEFASESQIPFGAYCVKLKFTPGERSRQPYRASH